MQTRPGTMGSRRAPYDIGVCIHRTRRSHHEPQAHRRRRRERPLAGRGALRERPGLPQRQLHLPPGPGARPAEPLALNGPYPYFDETRACQDRVRRDFLSKNEGDAYLEFTGMSDRESLGSNRERIRGDAWARNRSESRGITYECVLNDRTNRVLSSSYELRGRGRYSMLN